jgi:hypothetical protein
LAAE